MASITVGGKVYDIPEMNFLAIERAWPYVVEATESLDPMKGPSAALGVFAAAIMEGEEFNPSDFGIENTDELKQEQIFQLVLHFFKKNLKAREIGLVKGSMFEVLKEAGLEVTEGEAIAAFRAALEVPEDQEPSLETAPDTLPSSLPQGVKEEAGTE